MANALAERLDTSEHLIGPLGWRLQKFFTRRPNAFGARVTWHGARYMLREMVGGGVKMRICRIPAEYVAEAMIQRPHGKRHETAEHRQIKRACLLWMLALGGKDAAEEQGYCAGIADVLSDDLNWVVECGHTGIDKPQTLVLADPTTRFTLVPYQELMRADGSARSLIGVDFVWAPEAIASVHEAWNIETTCAAASLCFKPLPTPPRAEGA